MKRSTLAEFFLATAAALLIAVTGPIHAQVPQIINYQGRISAGGIPFTGVGQFKFALVSTDGSATYWSNDGTSTAGSEPTASVSLPSAAGLYVAPLGDTTIAGMLPVPASVFSNNGVKLRVWFNDGTNGSQLLAPDQPVLSVAYAMMAAGVQNAAITTAMIAPGAVTSDKMAADSSIPPGTVVAFAGTAAPAGWVFCDGSSKLKTDSIYARLFSVIGTGHGGNTTNFNLPDYRGRFLRGVDGTNSRDPDRNSRSAMNTGGNSGNNVGSIQADEFRSHSHPVGGLNGQLWSNGSGAGFAGGGGQFNPTAFVSVLATGGAETRPINAYVNYIIKL